jgi:hypothetical protein
VYYKARSLALANGADYHLAAFAKNGDIGVNNDKNTAKFWKRYANNRSRTFHDRHAEVDLIVRSRCIHERIFVARFLNDGSPTMALPCKHCQNFLRHRGVKVVRYTNWDGDWEELRL